MNNHFALIALGLIVCAGCGDIGGNRRQASGSVGGTGLVGSSINDLAAGPAQPAGAPAAQPGQPAGAPIAGQPGAVPAPAQPLTPGSPEAGAPQAAGSLPGLPGVPVPGQPQLITEKAQVGATGKGNYGGPGAVTTPISVYFQAQERLIYDSVTYAVKLFEAEHGYKPKTEQEFMKQVIEFNQIKLPQLPPGHKYKYDPQTGELMVEHPQK